MKKKKNYEIAKYLKIIKQIENIRKKNNVNWMNLLRLAFKSSPKKTANFRIYSTDSQKKIQQNSGFT